MRIKIRVGDVYVCPALTSKEFDEVCYLAKRPDPGVVLEHLSEISEEFVIANFGQPAYNFEEFSDNPFVISNETFRDYQVQAEVALVDIINEIREPSSELAPIITDADDEY